MKKIIKTTKRNWQCPYCGFLNDLTENTCKKCGAIRNGDEVEKEITTEFEETSTTETSEASDIDTIDFSTAISTAIIGYIVVAIVLISICIGAYRLTVSKEKEIDENYTIVNKEWEYTLSIGKYVTETRKSATTPPQGATNVEAHQIQQENGWYRTEYTYDYAEWKVTRTETVTGSDAIPTFAEYTELTEGEKVLSTSLPRYTVTVITPSGKQVIKVTESQWITFVTGKTYPASEF